MWQDYVIALVQWALIIALIPTIRDPKKKPPISSCFFTAVPLLVLGATLLTLGLWNGGFSAIGGGLVWSFIAWQRYRLDTAAIS